MAEDNTFSFFLSSDLDVNVVLTIDKLEGKIDNFLLPQKASGTALGGNSQHLYVDCAFYANGQPLCLPKRTAPRPYLQGSTRFDETLHLGVRFRDLPLNTCAVFTVWGILEPRKKALIGGTTCPVFGKHKTFKKGRKKLLLWPKVEGDAVGFTTAGHLFKKGEVDRIERLLKKYDRHELPHIEWLDKWTWTAMPRVKQKDNSDALFLSVQTNNGALVPIMFGEVLVKAPQSAQAPGTALVFLPDPEISHSDNPTAAHHAKLVSSQSRRTMDPNLKPNTRELAQIESILEYPPTKALTLLDEDIIWRFRYYLRNRRAALTKFLKAVNWTQRDEVLEAQKLLEQWEPIETADALELLSGNFTAKPVKEYAVRRLATASDAEFFSYLLQLVQALRWDKESFVTNFVFTRASENLEAAVRLLWYLTVEASDGGQFFAGALQQFQEHLGKSERGRGFLKEFEGEQLLVEELSFVHSNLKKVPKKQKDAAYKEIIQKTSLVNLKQNISIPLIPSKTFKGLALEDGVVFSSALSPFKLGLICTDHTKYSIISKSGDDMRQDQLVIQMISLMDSLLKKQNMDCRLTPYRVLATSPNDGMVEFVRSKSINKILLQYQTIQAYLKENNPDPSHEYGIREEALTTFVRSCAGYAVITYILGVGDRHLDNLLITPDGALFHIDFGYILGREPPFKRAPAIRVAAEMIDAMGGQNTRYYANFVTLACEAYNILRRSSNLVLNLLTLMTDSKIPDLQGERSIFKVQEKFNYDLNDEEASQVFNQLINESVNAVMVRLFEGVHRLVN